MVSPLWEDDRLDENNLRKQVDFAIDAARQQLPGRATRPSSTR